MTKSKSEPGIALRRNGTLFERIGNMVPKTEVTWGMKGQLSTNPRDGGRTREKRTKMTKMAPTRRPTRPTDVGPQASSTSDI